MIPHYVIACILKVYPRSKSITNIEEAVWYFEGETSCYMNNSFHNRNVSKHTSCIVEWFTACYLPNIYEPIQVRAVLESKRWTNMLRNYFFADKSHSFCTLIFKTLIHSHSFTYFYVVIIIKFLMSTLDLPPQIRPLASRSQAKLSHSHAGPKYLAS